MDKPLLDNARNVLNLGGLATVFVTVDVDWAPDFMVNKIVDCLEENSIRATIFATHRSELLLELRHSPLIEIAAHPYISEESSQGSSLAEALDNLLDIYPGLVGSRFHRLAHSYADLSELAPRGFRYDVSRLLWNSPHLRPAFHGDLGLFLLPYSWEDGINENQRNKGSLGDMNLASPGMKILNFHPMNVYMNFRTSSQRRAFQAVHPNLLLVNEDSIQPREGNGSGAVFEEFCRFISESGVRSELLGSVDWSSVIGADLN